VPSLREGFPWNATFRTSREVKGRVTSRSENSAMPACPHHHSEACPQRHRAQPGREAGVLPKRREWTLCLSSGTGIASCFASSGVLPTRMGRSTFEPGARVRGWVVRGMRSAVLRPWRRCAGAVCASRLKYWCRLLFDSAMPKRPTDQRWDAATRSTGVRAIAPADRSGHVHRRQRSQQQLGAASSPGLEAGAPNIG
jgi:hypothetical protein